MLKGKLLLLATLAVMLSLGMTPIAKADVEMSIQPDVTYAHPGDSVFFRVDIVNHDAIWYSCSLSLEVTVPNGRVIHGPERNFRLRPLHSVTRPLIRHIPWFTPPGEYVGMLRLYNRSTGELLDDARAYIIVVRVVNLGCQP